MARVFLSHSSRNSAEAIAFQDWLLEQGWDDLFLDLDPERGIKAGERWQEALRRANSSCEFVIFLISPAWVESKWCLAEFLQAKTMNKRIFGVIVEPTPLSDLPVEMTSEWQLVDLSSGEEKRSFSVALPAWHKGVSDEIAFSKEGLERLHIGLQEAGLDARFFAWPPENDPDRAPYRGLEPLEMEDAGIFFGRDGPIVEVLDRLRGLRDDAPPRFLVILGASGAGKSSFMRAGILPRLKRDLRNFLPLPVLRPGRAAISGDGGLVALLARALEEAGQKLNRAEVREAVTAGPESLQELLRRLLPPQLAGAPGQVTRPPTIVLPIDQGEELFGGDGAEESGVLLDLLAALLAEDEPALAVMVTIRSDSYEALQTAEALEGLRQEPYSLPPMPRGAYSEVITAPARQFTKGGRPLVIEEQLTEALITDLEQGDAKDALPLLAFTLERLYRDYGSDGDLRLDEYEALGRIRGSIEAAVAEAYRAADGNPAIPRDPEARRALLRRGLIPWLAGIDPDTGSPRRRVAPLDEIPTEARPLIDLLVEQRLLSKDRDPASGEVTLEPAHEALLRQWGVLKGWLEEDAGTLAILEAVKRASRDWEANARRPAWLAHSGTRLAEARAVVDREDFSNFVKAKERSYLQAAGEAEVNRIRRERRLNRALRIAFAVAFLGLIIAGWKWSDAARALAKETEERQAKQAALAEKTTALETVERERNAKKAALTEKTAALASREKALSDYDRLADVKRLEAAIAAADELYPPSPDLVPRLLVWQKEYGSLAEKIEGHKSFLAELRLKALPDGDVAVKWDFQDQALQFQNDVLGQLVTDLESFANSETGPVKSVARRLAQSQAIAKATLEGEVAARWTACRERIAANPKYAGLDLAPQLGLIPLGPDPDSGLEEFLHWLTHEGEIPARDETTGKIAVTEELGVVLVLIPGGTFLMGSQKDDPAMPNFDPDSQSDEQPVNEVALQPYLLSKYEMTQAQWQRAFQANPSSYEAGDRIRGVRAPVNARHPVENISWNDARELLPRIDLVLPTEAEWERAARAGRTDLIYAGTSEIARLRDFANISGSETEGSRWPMQEGHVDDYLIHAPVGSLAPNAYGLHDMTGNVWECCLDGAGDRYTETPGPRGLRDDPSSSPYRVTSGSSFNYVAAYARVAYRHNVTPGYRNNYLGLRPSRIIP